MVERKNGQSDTQNADVFPVNFGDLLNREILEVDKEEILSQIKRQKTIEELDEPITMDKELENHITQAKNSKAPGESGVTVEALKCLMTHGKTALLDLLKYCPQQRI